MIKWSEGRLRGPWEIFVSAEAYYWRCDRWLFDNGVGVGCGVWGVVGERQVQSAACEGNVESRGRR